MSNYNGLYLDNVTINDIFYWFTNESTSVEVTLQLQVEDIWYDTYTCTYVSLTTSWEIVKITQYVQQ